MKLYLDSNVLIAYLRSEIDGAFNLRFLQSEKFFIFCKESHAELILSPLFFAEIKKIIYTDKKAVLEFLEEFGLNLKVISTAKYSNIDEINRKTGIHFSDAEHVANALNSACKYIITFNEKDFKKAEVLIPYKTPAEFTRDF